MRNPLDRWKKQTALFMTSQALSLFGSSLVSYAIFWRITLDTQSGFMMTLYMIFGFLPTFFLSPFAGVWADRYDRKRLIMLSDGGIALATLMLAALFMAGYRDLWLLFIIPFIRALGTAVQSPAVNAFLPQIVPEDRLMKANGLFSSLNSAIMLVSPVVSGALMSVTSFERILMIDVATALAAILVLSGLKVTAPAKHTSVGEIGSSVSERSELVLNERPASNKQYWQELAAGLHYIRSHDYLGRFFGFIAILFLLVTPVAMLTPLQVTRSFGDEIWRLTSIEVSFSVGMLGGGLLIAAWGGFKNRVRMMAFALLIIGVTTFLLGVVPNFWIYLTIMAVVGLTLPLYNTPATVLLQEKVEAAYLGRVFGIMGMISSGIMPLSMFVYGPLADIIQIEWLLIGSGLMMILLAFSLAANKQLMLAGEPAMVEKPSAVWTDCPAGQEGCPV